MTKTLPLTRRTALACLLAPVAAATFGALPAHAQTYPNKPIRIIVPYAAGTATDTIARLAAQQMSDALKQPVVVDNRAGANGAIGTSAVAKAPADGYTLLVTTNTTQAANLSLMKSLPYDPQKDFAPVSMIGKGVFVLATRTDAPFGNLAEFLAYAKANPGKASYASANGSGIVSGATLALKTKHELIHVPYKSGPAAMTDVIGGQVSTLFIDIQSALPQLRSGKLKALAVTTAQPHPLLPGVLSLRSAPGMAGFDLSYWMAVYAPAGTPAPILEVLNQQFMQFTRTPAVVSRFADLGFAIEGSSGTALDQFTRSEIGKWRELIAAAGIEAE
ncbi:hypothetical protein B2J86_11030 [Acidovorax sp. SRB_14]|uniref:Bug family tripartite tricarboxylate transporter substrate binding protein n=1 Tax=Acidovorax sp. SRB_14 TaxID=1962699 RepID=UPI0015675781|nr:tripartite tricarboxylate transporter substrate binding protein [Acidovorax sp. SRB_14]NMM81447.1 hypothetical protein [Acidovorax sp. SRB_14]